MKKIFLLILAVFLLLPTYLVRAEGTRVYLPVDETVSVFASVTREELNSDSPLQHVILSGSDTYGRRIYIDILKSEFRSGGIFDLGSLRPEQVLCGKSSEIRTVLFDPEGRSNERNDGSFTLTRLTVEVQSGEDGLDRFIFNGEANYHFVRGLHDLVSSVVYWPQSGNISTCIPSGDPLSEEGEGEGRSAERPSLTGLLDGPRWVGGFATNLRERAGAASPTELTDKPLQNNPPQFIYVQGEAEKKYSSFMSCNPSTKQEGDTQDAAAFLGFPGIFAISLLRRILRKRLAILAIVFTAISFGYLSDAKAMVAMSRSLTVTGLVSKADFDTGDPEKDITLSGTAYVGQTVEVHLPLKMLRDAYPGGPESDPLPLISKEIQTRLEGVNASGNFLFNTGGKLNSFDLTPLPESGGSTDHYLVIASVEALYYQNDRETHAFHKVVFILTEGAWESSAHAIETVEETKTFFSGLISLDELEADHPTGIVVLENDPSSDPDGPRYRFIVPLSKLKEGGLKITDRIPSERGSVDLEQKVGGNEIGVDLLWADLVRRDASFAQIEFTLTKINRPMTSVRAIQLEGRMKYSYQKAKGRYYPIVEFNRSGAADFSSLGGAAAGSVEPGVPVPIPPPGGVPPAGEILEIDPASTGLAGGNTNNIEDSDQLRNISMGGGGGSGWTCNMMNVPGATSFNLGSSLLLFFLGGLLGLSFRKRWS